MIVTIIITLAIAISLLGCYFIHHQNNLKVRAHLMREAVRNHDFTFRLPVKGLFYGEKALQEVLNDLGQEICRLVAENEVESWQRLTRVLTHEIMNVTTPIQSISQAYLEHPDVQGSSLEKGIQAINDASTHLVTFVDSYRKLTQLQEPMKSEHDLQSFIYGISALYPSLEWTINIPPTRISMDESLVRQLCINIIKNAMEANAKAIAFTWHDDSLHISNDGTPIPPEIRRDIFIPFYTTKQSGTGIGLALSRQLMAKQGGYLSLADKADSGYHTTFIVVFQ